MSNAHISPAILKSLDLFRDVADDDLLQIIEPAAGRLYTRGESVFEQGEAAHSFFVLLNGRLKVTQLTADGQQIIVRVVNPGDLFGIAKALQRTDYPGTATAATESLVLAWPMHLWAGFVGRYPAFATKTMQTIGGRLQEAHTRLREMATEEVERRVAHAVLRLVQQSGKKEAQGVRIDFPVSRQDIAEMTGTTLHTVSRILSAWEEADLVETGRQRVLVRDPHALLLIADGLKPGRL